MENFLLINLSEEQQQQEQQDETVDLCFISLIIWVSCIIHRVKECCSRIYTSSDIVKDTVDKISYCSTLSYNMICFKRTEPIERYWRSTCRIIDDGTLEERFFYENKETIFVKSGDFIIYRNGDFILCSQTGLIDIIESPIFFFSNIRFLSIEYNHPEMNNPIQLVLEKEWCVVGNEVLGKIHILRMLEYQAFKSQYIFDDRYTLKIIDSNINILEIGSRQQIRLEKEGISIL
jgi:hypothetical protein